MLISEMSELLQEIAGDGGADEEYGSASEAPFMWAGRFEFDAIMLRNLPMLKGYVGAILTCDGDGFYECYPYTDYDVLCMEWDDTVEFLALENEGE